MKFFLHDCMHFVINKTRKNVSALASELHDVPVVCLTVVVNNELTLTPLSSCLYLCFGETC